MNGAGSLLPVVIVIAALVIKTAIGELRRPGSARQQWAGATGGPAVAAGMVAAVAIAVTGWPQAGAAALAWAVLAGSAGVGRAGGVRRSGPVRGLAHEEGAERAARVAYGVQVGRTAGTSARAE